VRRSFGVLLICMLKYSIRYAAFDSTPLKPGIDCFKWCAPFPPLLRLNFTKKGAEPGYYADREYAIRIEIVVVVRVAQTPNNFGEKGFLGFEHVTMVSLFFAHPLTFGHHVNMDSARCPWDATSLTCHFFLSMSASGWMRIIRR
jgi:hypothetical protein